MPIDYSKFDNIEDSDEEKEPARGPATASAIQAAAQAANAFAPPARWEKEPAGPPRGREGRPLLEPVGREQRLQFVPPSASQPSGPSEMDMLARQMGVLAGPGSEPAAGDDGAEQDPSKPKRLCMRSDGRKKIHTTFPDGEEMVEEYDERTDVLMLRKVRKAAVLGKEAEWVFEVGQAPEAAFDPHSDFLRASTSNPIFLRKDTPEHFQWRIRNLSYPVNVYSVTVDHEKQHIVVRTSNKKYFKRIDVPDLARLGLKLDDAKLSWKHQHNTLIISYARPPEVAAEEQKALQEAERSSLKL